MKAFIFTHPPDYQIAYVAYEALKERAGVDEVVLAYDKAHSKPDPAFNSTLTNFQRFGNLNGATFMKGALDLYERESDGHDVILKVDSDTLVFNTDWVDHSSLLTGFEYEPHRPFYGMAYAIKAEGIPLIKDLLEISQYKLNFPEDIMIYELCKELGIKRYPYNGDTGPWAGWNWMTTKDSLYYRDRFSVINVYPPSGFSVENARRLILAKMNQLMEAKL